MADISLREYLAKLDTLLKSGSAAEVILHCRHILQYYPKDAQAYRLLGQALVATSRWAEAGEVMPARQMRRRQPALIGDLHEEFPQASAQPRGPFVAARFEGGFEFLR